MTTEIGVPNKTIKYINLHKEGTTAGEKCEIDDRWNNALIAKQNDYMVAITRFEVPLNDVPINRAIKDAIQIFHYPDYHHQNSLDLFQYKIRGLDVPIGLIQPNDVLAEFMPNVDTYIDTVLTAAVAAAEDEKEEDVDINITNGVVNDYLSFYENLITNSATEILDGDIQTHLAATIDLPECFTVFELITELRKRIKTALVTQIKPYKAVHTTVPTAYRQQRLDSNLLGYGDASNVPANNTDPVSMFDIEMSSDYKFKIRMNYWFGKTYYIKMNKELFKMFQFKELGLDTSTYARPNLNGCRFLADRAPQAEMSMIINDAPTSALVTLASTPRYFRDTRTINVVVPNLDTEALDISTRTQIALFYGAPVLSRPLDLLDYFIEYAAEYSSADTLNRIKSIVFTSSLSTKTEGSSGNTYRRFMTDYLLPTETSFSWTPATMKAGSINENAACELSYANPNPSSGRLLELTDPSPLYEIKLEVMAKCWNFLNDQFYFEKIYLPVGSTFTCKMVFISKNDIYQHDSKPDRSGY